MTASMSAPSPTPKPLRLLLLEDSAFDAELICEYLAKLAPIPEVDRVVGREDYLAALQRGGYDAILCDYSLPGFDGLSALRFARERLRETPFIFVSGVLGEETAIASFTSGATDYVLKQKLIRLPAAVERAVAEYRERIERRRTEERLQMLVAELSHRVKNTLATVMSIARRTAKSAHSVEDYETILISRLRALSDAHALVFEANWSETDLAQVMERTLRPFRREDRAFEIGGPHVALSPKAALTLSLVLHELATNAVRHGALSVETGSVTARWTIEEDGDRRLVHIHWQEQGGPAVEAPKRAGFGTTLLERSLAHDLDGEATISFAPEGFSCHLRFPAD
ncbi:Two-component sensor histidine kinase, contains HisKA and HATPase domains [Devosia enhydra]|uniref:histidine kinase n=1 Tax=Devosia enhydra TaxID=665118 RepID=A0A1K2HUZ7_9HYPH|nr:HWE histidine kinase domain-containing protein [Devosia enhydra]SFZ82458.1 Two-component sensor histidine kinase, contains HisKA and HATPase domains [Devosia enhydra]